MSSLWQLWFLNKHFTPSVSLLPFFWKLKCSSSSVCVQLHSSSSAAPLTRQSVSACLSAILLCHISPTLLQCNATQHVSQLTTRHPSLRSLWVTNPRPAAPACWRRATNHQRLDRRAGTQVCGGGGGGGRGAPAKGPSHSGLRHVPREGPTPPPPLPSEDSLFTPPDGGWLWLLMNAILHPQPPLPLSYPLNPPYSTPEHVSLQLATLRRTKAPPRESENMRWGGNTPCFIYYFTCNYDEELFTLLPRLDVFGHTNL